MEVSPRIGQGCADKLENLLTSYQICLMSLSSVAGGLVAVNTGAHAAGFAATHANFISRVTILANQLESVKDQLRHAMTYYEITDLANAANI